MNQATREAREEAAERELTGQSDHGARTRDEASSVLAGLERALTVQVPPQWARAVPVDESMMVSLTENLTNKRPRSGRVCSMVWAAAASTGLSWVRPRESRKGGHGS